MRHDAVLPRDSSTTLIGRPPVKSAVRVVDILEALATQPDGLSFSALGRRLGLPKSSLHELLAALTERGYIAFDEERRTYALGIRVWELGQAYPFHRDLLREAHRVMEGIVAEVNETVQLATLDGTDNVYLDKVDCSHPIRLQSHVGKRLPAYATGLGKVLLAALPTDDLQIRLDGQTFRTFTPRTVRDQAALLAELDAVRARGFAVDDQEYTEGLRCVAVPIVERGGCVTTALSASVPIMRASPDQLALALRALAAGSLEISRRLGVGTDDPRLRGLTHATAEMVAGRFRQGNGRDGS
jgi:DNA-binding IclR family transcriptional regulator